MLKYLIMNLWLQSWQKTGQKISPGLTYEVWLSYSNSSESNHGSSAFQGKTHQSNTYLKDFFLVWIWVIQSPSLQYLSLLD